MKHDHKRSLDRLSDYSDASLLKELKRIADSVGRTTLTIRDIEEHGRCSYAILKERFGGLGGALKAAGLSATSFHRDVSDEELLRELARIWDVVLAKEGRRPYKHDLVKYKSKFSQGPYYRRWGSWIRACEALIDSDPPPPQDSEAVGLTPNPTTRFKRTIPLRIRYAILLRDQFKCQLCGRSPSTTPGLEIDVDHIVSERDGGTLEPTNLRCLCKPCNLGKGRYSENALSGSGVGPATK